MLVKLQLFIKKKNVHGPSLGNKSLRDHNLDSLEVKY